MWVRNLLINLVSLPFLNTGAFCQIESSNVDFSALKEYEIIAFGEASHGYEAGKNQNKLILLQHSRKL